MPVRILLSCKHKVIAEGIAAVLRTHPDLELVSVCGDDEQTRVNFLSSRPAVVVLGVDPRSACDVELARWMAQQELRPEIVAFSTDCDRGAVLQMMQAGASSFVSTQSSMDELLQAIRAAGSGRSYLCSSARDRKSTRLNSSHNRESRMPSSA